MLIPDVQDENPTSITMSLANAGQCDAEDLFNGDARSNRHRGLPTESAEECEHSNFSQSFQAHYPPTQLPWTGRLGDFRRLREIGRGDTGVVYEAIQLSIGRRVALKVAPLPATRSTQQSQERWRNILWAASWRHRNIVPIYAAGCEQGLEYCATQLIDGFSMQCMIELQKVTLDQISRRPRTRAVYSKALSVTPNLESSTTTDRSVESLSLPYILLERIAKAAEALAHMHGLGLIHGAIKPTNLLIDRSVNIWITDSRFLQLLTDPRGSVYDTFAGVDRWMSPELACENCELIDHRTDIYSLGATLYEVLMLQPMLTSTHPSELLQMISSGNVKPLRRLNQAVPIPLETIVHTCLAKNPTERYATASDLAFDLRRFIANRPIQLRHPTFFGSFQKWIARSIRSWS